MFKMKQIIFALCAVMMVNAVFAAASDPSGLTLVDLTSPDGEVTSSRSDFVMGPQTAFNDHTSLNDNNNRLCIQSKAVDIVYKFETPTVVNSYRIYNFFNNKDYEQKTACKARAPRSWTFLGSNDGIDWVLLDEQPWEINWDIGEDRFYLTGNEVAYRYYKIDITNNNGNEYLQFAKLEYYNADTSSLPNFLTLGDVTATSTADTIIPSITYSTPVYASVTNVVMVYGESADDLQFMKNAEYSLVKASSVIAGLSPSDVRFFKFIVTAKNDSASITLESDVFSYGVRTSASLIRANNNGEAAYKVAENWSTLSVPNQYYVDIVVDGDDSKNSTLLATEKGFNATNGVLTITKGDTVNFSTSIDSGTTLNWYCSAITNFGRFVTNTKKKNQQNFNFYATRAPSYIASGASIEFNNPGGRTGNSRMYLLLDGTVNDGLISLIGAPKKQSYCSIEFKGGGTLINNSMIRIAAEGGQATEARTTSIAMTGGDSTITGSGILTLDYSMRELTGNQNVSFIGAGLIYTLCNDVNHTIIGGGSITECKFLNKGLIKADSDRQSLTIFVPLYGASDSRRPGPQIAKNDESGRIIAVGPKGVRFSVQKPVSSKYEERNFYNGHFLNCGLLESRTGSLIKFEPGINTMSGSLSSDTDVGGYETVGLELGGFIAGGGRFETRRLVYIDDGAVLAPGDRTDDTWDAESTCGTLTFSSNLVMRAGSVSEFQFKRADSFDSLHVGGTLKVDGTLKVVGRPHGGTYRMITSDCPITSDNEKFFSAFDMSEADGVRSPRLTSGSEEYDVEVTSTATDPESGEEITVTETVTRTRYYIDASFPDTFSIVIR